MLAQIYSAGADLFCWCSTEVVQLIRNQQVVGSIPTTSSTKSAGIARCLPIFACSPLTLRHSPKSSADYYAE